MRGKEVFKHAVQKLVSCIEISLKKNKLKKKYAVWVISNTTEAHIKSLQSQFVFLNSFNGLVTSERAGFHKPHPNIFKFALEEANTDAVSSIFIDDSYSNVESAENLGFISHHYIEFDKLMKFFQLFKINFSAISKPLS